MGSIKREACIVCVHTGKQSDILGIVRNQLFLKIFIFL